MRKKLFSQLQANLEHEIIGPILLAFVRSPHHKMRSVWGVARDTGMDQSDVEKILEDNPHFEKSLIQPHDASTIYRILPGSLQQYHTVFSEIMAHPASYQSSFQKLSPSGTANSD
jgi:hypothetical protein